MIARISNQTVVVTGGSSGIGLGLVERLLARNNTVHTTSRSADAASRGRLRELQLAHGDRLRVTQLDVAREDSVKAWAAALQQCAPHVDVLVNNAGIYGPPGGPGRPGGGLADLCAQDFMEVFATNTIGPFLVAQQLLKLGMLGSGGGGAGAAAAGGAQGRPSSLVVNISSVMASLGHASVSGASGGAYAYKASKAALNMINKAMALDLAKDGIQCVLMHPGYVKGTGITGELGWIDVSESADGILNVLESGRPLNGCFLDYSGATIPW